jgi:hypothetical protein
MDIEQKELGIHQQDSLGFIQEMGAFLDTLDEDITQKEKELNEAKAKFKNIAEKVLPDMMMNLGLEEIKLRSGKKITLKEVVSAKVLNNGAYAWLEDNNCDSLVKREVKVPYSYIEELKKTRLPHTIDYSIHHMQLKSLMKDLKEQGIRLPSEFFQTYEGHVVTFK